MSRVPEVPSALAIVAVVAAVAAAAAAVGPRRPVDFVDKVAAGTVAAAVVVAAVVSPCPSICKSGPGTQTQNVPTGGQRCPGTCSPRSSGRLLFCFCGLRCWFLLDLLETGIEGSCGLVKLGMLLLCGITELPS